MAVVSADFGDPIVAADQRPPTPSADLPKGSPLWWVQLLAAKLVDRNGELRHYEEYYEGKHKLAFATEQFRKAFGYHFRSFSDNFMQVVVDSVDERLAVEGFRIPIEGADPADLLTGDDEAWTIWQANQMDAESQLVHTDALVDGISYAIVGPGETYPEITGESARQVIVEHAPGYNARRLAALKCWMDDDDLVYATLYLPGAIYKYVSDKPQLHINAAQVRWVRRGVAGEPWPLRNPLGVVPVVPFCNRPRLVVEGRSEIAQLIPLQDAINKLFMDMLIASEFAGFPQRVATGIELPVEPETNQPVADALKLSLDRFLHTDNPEARFDTLEAAQLSNYTGAIAMAIQHLATRSSTPPHYFLANMGNFPSGEALKAAETGLVSKVRRRMKHFGEAWEEVIRLALAFAGQEAKAVAAFRGETIWADPESRSESEHIDAILKLSALGIPAEILWEKSGMFTPTEIGRMKELIAAGALVITPAAPEPQGGRPQEGERDASEQRTDAGRP